MLRNKDHVKDWLEDVGIRAYDVHDNGVVDVYGDVVISHRGLVEIPVQFGVVMGSFFCNHNHLTSLAGCPHKVGHDFICRYNKLTSLAGCPKVVEDFRCQNNVQFESNPFGYKELLDIACDTFSCRFEAVNAAMNVYAKDRSPLNKLKVVQVWEESYVKD